MDVRGHAIFDTHIPEKIKILVPFEHEILDYYVNGHTRGLDGFMHKDDADYTFIVFCNPVWDIMWGGKTMFVQDDGRFDVYFLKQDQHYVFRQTFYIMQKIQAESSMELELLLLIN